MCGCWYPRRRQGPDGDRRGPGRGELHQCVRSGQVTREERRARHLRDVRALEFARPQLFSRLYAQVIRARMRTLYASPGSVPRSSVRGAEDYRLNDRTGRAEYAGPRRRHDTPDGTWEVPAQLVLLAAHLHAHNLAGVVWKGRTLYAPLATLEDLLPLWAYTLLTNPRDVRAGLTTARVFFRCARSEVFRDEWRFYLAVSPLTAVSWFFARARRHPGAGEDVLPRLPALAHFDPPLAQLESLVW